MNNTGVTMGATGLGSGFLLVWFWNSILLPKYGFPEITGEVGAAIAPVLVAVANYFGQWLPKGPKAKE